MWGTLGYGSYSQMGFRDEIWCCDADAADTIEPIVHVNSTLINIAVFSKHNS